MRIHVKQVKSGFIEDISPIIVQIENELNPALGVHCELLGCTPRIFGGVSAQLHAYPLQFWDFSRNFRRYNWKMGSGFTSHLKGWLSSLGFILLTLLVIAVGEWLPYMPAFERFQKAHPSLNQVLIAITLAMTILGGLLLVFTQFLVRLPDVQTTETKGRQKGRGWVFSGATLTAGFSDEARFWRVRKAFRDGEWWRSPRWRRI